MSRPLQILALLVLAQAAAGCGSAAKESASETVRAYLEACRRGDVDQAEALLSTPAQEQTRALELDVTFARSDSAQFEVGDVELVGADVAHVASTWTDDGEASPITWALRLEDSSWRITGMCVPVSGGESQWLDFEHPDQLQQAQRLGDESSQ